MNNTLTILTVLVSIAVGSGSGGIISSFIMVRRFKLEQSASKTKEQVDLAQVDVDHFKAMFPGGLGDAVEHWRDEAKSLYEEVDNLREQRGTDHDAIIRLKSELADTKRDLRETRRELARANGRIEQLESERCT